MQVFKHNKKDKFIFMRDRECFIFEKYNNKFKTDSFYFEDKRYEKFINGMKKKGFEPFDITKEIEDKTKEFISNLKLSTDYIFIEKNQKDILKSNIFPLRLVERGGEETQYILYIIDQFHKDEEENTIFSSLQDWIDMKVATDYHRLGEGGIEEELVFHLNIAFVLGFEIKTPNESFEIIFEEMGFEDEDNKKIFSQLIKETTEKTEAKKFVLPERITFKLEELPLQVPNNEIDIAKFEDEFLAENKFYFFANTRDKDPMKWKVVCISLVDSKEHLYRYTEPFYLKEFNDAIKNILEIEVRSYDMDEFQKKLKKLFKAEKIDTKSIDPKTIIKALSTKSVEELNTQTKIKSFASYDKNFANVMDFFENYALIRSDDTSNPLLWQFFKDTKEREKWLKEIDEHETKFYKDEIETIENFTTKYLKKYTSKRADFKDKLLDEPSLKSYFSSARDKKEFLESDVLLQEGKHVKDDYIFSFNKKGEWKSKIVVVEGDLTVEGTLFFKQNRHIFIVIEGDLKAKNFICDERYTKIFVKGDIQIENIATNYGDFVVKNAKTYILLHEREDDRDGVYTPFEYDLEVSSHSDIVIDKSLVVKDSIWLRWETDKLYTYLSKNKSIFTKKPEKKADIDEDEKDKYHFENMMNFTDDCYPRLAGFQTVDVVREKDVVGDNCYSSSDLILHDVRGRTGTYVVYHDNISSAYVAKLKNPESYGIDYSQKPLDLKVSSADLLSRYCTITEMFSGIARDTTADFTTDDEKKEKYWDKRYEEEKEYFVDEEHLALYWLIRFGLTLDARYAEVVKIVEENNLAQVLLEIKYAMAFFKLTDEFYEVDVQEKYKNEDEKDFEDLFLKRRSYLVYIEHSYKNSNPKDFELWYKSIIIYPKPDSSLIKRVKWLRNNLKDTGLWSEFDKLLEDKYRDTPLLSYIFANDPNRSEEEKAQFSDRFVKDLKTYEKHWNRGYIKSFAQRMLWDVREFVGDKKLFKSVVEEYFESDKNQSDYLDILNSLGVDTTKTEEIIKIDKDLKEAFGKHFKNQKEPISQVIKNNKEEINALLKEVNHERFIEIIHEEDLNYLYPRFYFVYLWDSDIDIKIKKPLLIKLFTSLKPSEYEFMGTSRMDYFSENRFQNLLKDESDPNLEVVKELLTMPEIKTEESDECSFEFKFKLSVAYFFMGVAHKPKVFDFLIKFIQVNSPKKSEYALNAIFQRIFYSYEYTTPNADARDDLNKEQIERLFETISHSILKYGHRTDACYTITYCDNLLIKEWAEEKMEDESWLKRYAHMQTDDGERVDEVMKYALTNTWSQIENKKYDTYLEYKDEKSHKFWKIEFYGHDFDVTFGKVGNDGRTINSDYDTIERMVKTGLKKIDEKLKQGYTRIAIL